MKDKRLNVKQYSVFTYETGIDNLFSVNFLPLF